MSKLVYYLSSQEILVYTDEGVGASTNCVTMTLTSLRDVSNLQYTVRTTTSEELVGSKWIDSCHLLVMPGGHDLPYCSELNGQGNKQIGSFVREGGSYFGICAGAYYGSAYVEFDKGDPNMEVVGPRELAFFPVTAKGPVFPGYNYKTNKGAHAAGATITKSGKEILGLTEETISLFYNGGCEFTPRKANEPSKQNGDSPYEVLVTYTGHSEPRSPDPSPVSGSAAIIGGSVGQGKVVLTGLHFEASVSSLEKCYYGDSYVTNLLPILESWENQRKVLFDSSICYLLNSRNTNLVLVV